MAARRARASSPSVPAGPRAPGIAVVVIAAAVADAGQAGGGTGQGSLALDILGAAGVLALGLLTAEEFDETVRPEKMV